MVVKLKSNSNTTTNSKGEPLWNSPEWDFVFPTRVDIIKALNVHNLVTSKEEAREYLTSYLSLDQKQKSLANKIPLSEHIVLGYLCRMKTSGKYIFPDETEASFTKELELFSSKLRDVEEVVEKPVVNVQAYIKNKTDEFVEQLLFICEDVLHGDITEFSMYEWIKQNDVKVVHANKFISVISNFVQQIEQNYASKDDFVKESYRFLNSKKVKQISSICEKMIADVERFLGNAKTTRKPRKKKTIKVEKLVSKIKFKQSDAEYKLQSINPGNIVGCEQLWVFNTKTRKLGVYHAEDADGIKIRGTTLLNFSKNSVEKTLRKPEQVLTNVLESGKIGLRKVMDSINSKEALLTGRINKDIILLRAIR